MKKLALFLGITLSLAPLHLVGQQAAKPTTPQTPALQISSPEIQKLTPWTGKWKLSETAAPTPFGPAGDATYVSETRFVHGGVAMESKGRGKGGGGPLTWTETVYYDRNEKAYRNLYIDSTGIISASVQTIENKSIRGEWTTEVAGKRYHCRAHSTLSNDGKSFTYVWTFSEDGVNWKPWLNGTGRKVGRAPSK